MLAPLVIALALAAAPAPPANPVVPPCGCGCMKTGSCKCKNCCERTADPNWKPAAPKAAAAKAEGLQTFIGPLGDVSFSAIGGSRSLTFWMNVLEKDPRARPYQCMGNITTYSCGGVAATEMGAIAWINQNLERTSAGGNTIEAEVTFDAHSYLQVRAADFRIVPRSKYYEADGTVRHAMLRSTPLDPYGYDTYAAFYKHILRGGSGLLYVGVPDTSIGTYQVHCRVDTQGDTPPGVYRCWNDDGTCRQQLEVPLHGFRPPTPPTLPYSPSGVEPLLKPRLQYGGQSSSPRAP